MISEMTVGEAIQQMELLQYEGTGNHDERSALAASYRACGIEDGADLAEGFNRCISVWKKVRAPRAVEFKAFMPEQKLIADRVYRFDWPAYREAYADCVDWAWKKLIELHGNPQAVGSVVEGVQMSAWFAPENEWLRRFQTEKKVNRYVRLKLRHEDGFGGIENVEAAKARLFPTLAEVQRAERDAA